MFRFLIVTSHKNTFIILVPYWKHWSLFVLSALCFEVCSITFSPAAAGGFIVASDPVGVSPHGLCVFVTSQRESQPKLCFWFLLKKEKKKNSCEAESAACALQVALSQEERLLSELEELSCSCRHPLSYTSAAKCFAGLVNKKPQGAPERQVFVWNN